jgi:hypothetical protein
MVVAVGIVFGRLPIGSVSHLTDGYLGHGVSSWSLIRRNPLAEYHDLITKYLDGAAD